MEIQSGTGQLTDQVIEKKDDIKSKRAEAEKQKLKKACADFESLFVYQLFKGMRRTVPQSGLMGKMLGKDTYEMMLDQKIADEMATKRDGIGLQKMLLEQMDRSTKIQKDIKKD
jgi:peptidoglycan hydrolase FlgJ